MTTEAGNKLVCSAECNCVECLVTGERALSDLPAVRTGHDWPDYGDCTVSSQWPQSNCLLPHSDTDSGPATVPGKL